MSEESEQTAASQDETVVTYQPGTFKESVHEEILTVASYRPTEFAESEWIVISEQKPDASFARDEFPRLSEGTFAIDPMFANFDGEFAASARRDAGAFDEVGAQLGDESASIRLHGEVSEATGEEDREDLGDTFQEELGSIGDDGESSLEIQAESSELTEEEKRLAELSDEAYSRGRADAQAEADSVRQELEDRYQQLFDDLQTQVTESIRSHEHQAVDFAFQIARKLVSDMTEERREYVLDIIKQALAAAGGAEIQTVRVSPADFEFLSLNKHQETLQSKGKGNWTFESDDSIRAGCIVTTSAGEIDFDIEKAWTRLRDKTLQGPRT